MMVGKARTVRHRQRYFLRLWLWSSKVCKGEKKVVELNERVTLTKPIMVARPGRVMINPAAAAHLT